MFQTIDLKCKVKNSDQNPKREIIWILSLESMYPYFSKARCIGVWEW